jgi:predicted ester cyclase
MTTSEAEKKAVVRRFYEAFEANDVATLNEVLSPDVTAYSPHTPDPQNRETHVEGIRMWNAAFSGTHFSVEEQIAEGESVATRVTLRATHSRGDFQGVAPTGKQITMSGISIERVRNGKIVERRVSSDWLGLVQQLGIVPSAQATR